jgi:NTP pyrophosphatase (non-canonical NTP hydrolase)
MTNTHIIPTASAFDTYQKLASGTAIYPKETALAYLTTGLSGEAGEVCGKIGKVFRGDKAPVSKDEVCKELGDVLWFVSELARLHGLTLHEVAEKNIQKLYDRKDRGVIRGNGDNR